MKILVAIRREFPFGGAYSLRIKSLVSAIENLGHQIIVLCEINTGMTEPNYYLEFCSKGNKIFSSSNGEKKRRQEIKDYENLANKIIVEEKPDLIISSSMYDRFWRILRLSKIHNLPIILESCERFHYSGFKGGPFDVRYLMFSFCWYFLYRKCDGVITISRYLENYFTNYKMKVIRIPTIVDIESTNYLLEKTYDDRVSLLFAGSLSRTKDSIKEFVEAVSDLGNLRKKFVFNIYGVEKKEVIEHLGKTLYENNHDIINIYGHIPQDQINSIYQNNDFGIFFRKHIRSSEAGFSTKLGEGMAAGTPFIVNNTGDISLYIKNGFNGYVLENESKEYIQQVLLEILSMSISQRNTMRLNARETASVYFNSKSYERDLNCFLNDVIEPSNHSR